MSDKKVAVQYNSGVGEVDSGAFLDNLPSGLTEEHFQKVDDYRDEFAAQVGQHMLAAAPAYFESNPKTNLSLAPTSMGGNTTLEATLTPEMQMTVAIKVDSAKSLNAVFDQVKELKQKTLSSD